MATAVAALILKEKVPKHTDIFMEMLTFILICQHLPLPPKQISTLFRGPP